VPGGQNVNIMLGNRKLVLDNFCEVHDLLGHWADDSFWDLDQHTVVPGALYLIGSQQFFKHKDKIRQLVEKNVITAALSNPAEGSATIKWKIHRLELFEFIQQGKMFVISGGDIEPEYCALIYDSFLPKILDYKENLQAIDQAQDIYNKINKPYKFLFLNGRARYHRKYLLEEFQQLGLLQQSLWTNLDVSELDPRQALWNPPGTRTAVPIKFLPVEYEVTRYRELLQSSHNTFNHSGNREANTIGPLFNKNLIFGSEWGEIYLQAEPYIDTYFSLVTETVFEYPHSFRTEKIWKPIATGHPFVAVANCGYYRDLRNLGFQTFGSIIDESFDQIDDNQTRINQIINIVTDLCRQDLVSFLEECYNTCKYNQQHLAEMSIKVRKEFPDRFAQFIKNFNE
jgi:hypothetical protein